MKFAGFRQWLALVFHREEHRCMKCADRAECPAANTGVCYPCPHYQKED